MTRSFEPDPDVVAKILCQSFSYSLVCFLIPLHQHRHPIDHHRSIHKVLPSDYRALTWTLANRTQRSAQEGHALKFAVNFLIVRVLLVRSVSSSARVDAG